MEQSTSTCIQIDASTTECMHSVLVTRDLGDMVFVGSIIIFFLSFIFLGYLFNTVAPFNK